MISIQPARNRRKFFRPSKSNSRTKIHISKPPNALMNGPKPKTAAEQQGTGH